MDSNLADKNNGDKTIYIYINIFFAIAGIIFYLISCLLFKIYFKSINFVRSEIFTYILLHSLKHIVGILLPNSSSLMALYCFSIFEFFLILSHLNKCFSSKNISENTSLYELEYKYLILSIFIVVFFPYELYFKLIGQYIFSLYIIKLILSLLFFRYINIKMGLILEYIKDKKVTNATIPDIYLPYIKANYYYTNFSKVDNIFCLAFTFVIIYYVVNILNLFFEFQMLYKYLQFFLQEIIYLCIVISFLIYFYCLNKDSFTDKKIIKEEGSNLNKFKVIDVDITHEEDEENIIENQNEINNKNIKSEKEGDENDKIKKGDKNNNNNEESEKLKN